MRKLNHSPLWYYQHCLAENGGSPMFRAMLTNDMKFIGADIDSTRCYQERIPTYEAKWNEKLSSRWESDAVTQGEIKKVTERELFARPIKPKRKKQKKIDTTVSDRFFG